MKGEVCGVEGVLQLGCRLRGQAREEEDDDDDYKTKLTDEL